MLCKDKHYWRKNDMYSEIILWSVADRRLAADNGDWMQKSLALGERLARKCTDIKMAVPKVIDTAIYGLNLNRY